ncbi:MAG: hypothetical protein ACOWWH_12550 [Eubacteriaceae bacterium]
MKAIEKLKQVISKNNSNATVIKVSNNTYGCASFPSGLEINIKDYINTHFKVQKKDHYGVIFRV